MRSLTFFAAAVILMIATIAGAADKQDEKTFSIASEMGRVVLHGPASDNFDDSHAFGFTLDYYLTQNVRAELPVLLSKHDGNDELQEGEDASLTMVTVTPGFNFGSTGRVRYWLFLGMGAGFVDSSVETDDGKAENNEVGFATNIRTGIDVDVFRSLFTGVGVGVTAISAEAEQLSGSAEWEIISYYTVNLRLGYTF